MDVEEERAGKLVTEVLANRMDPEELLAIDQVCIAEAVVRAGQHVELAPGKGGGVALGPAMDFIPLWHQVSLLEIC